jgi:uncharacterized protein YdeI (YjbR/CyaY-like superfamily)
MLREFQANDAAWRFFEAQPPSYRKVVVSWVMTAKREETRRRRFDRLAEECAAGRRLGQFVSPTRAGGG